MRSKFSYIGVAIFLLLASFGVSYARIWEIRVSNITSSSAVISWMTDEMNIGTVDYGTDSTALTSSESESVDTDAHWVQLKGLDPETIYHYQITSGTETTEVFSFQTSKVGMGVPYTVYGQVIDSYAGTPAADVVVYVTLYRGTDESTILSTLTDANGMWQIDLGNLKDPVTGDAWNWSVVDDLMKIEAMAGLSGWDKLIDIPVTGDSPQDCGPLTLRWEVRDIQLSRDLTLIALPLWPVPAYTSHDVIDELTSETVTRWNEAQYWESAVYDTTISPPGPSGEDFDLDIGVGYFIQMDMDDIWTVEGWPVDYSPIILNLVEGLNLVGIPYPEGLSSFDLLSPTDGIPGCVRVVKWNEELQFWEGATEIGGSILGDDFLISDDRGYFVQVTSATTWTPPETPPVQAPRIVARRPVSLKLFSDRELTSLLDSGVSNLTSVSATITWYTDGMGEGKVLYGERPDKLDRVVESNGLSAAHMIRLSNLMPDTTYYYRVITSYRGKKVVGPLSAFTTSKVGAGMTRMVCGKLLDYDGSPLTGKAIYLRVKGSRGESSLLSCITDTKGYWWFDLGNLKGEDGRPYVYRQGDEIEMKVLPGGEPLLRGKVEGRDVQYVGDLRLSYEMRDITERPSKSELLQNYPNPFNPETWIPFKLDRGSDVRIEIYDVRGRLIRRLDLGYLRAGYYIDRSRAAYWDGSNEHGEQVASGVYFYMLKADHFTSTRKMIVIR
jgi:hypothetical protein